ncbi:MAG: hypothetical protein HC835_03760 [Oscillatoriales cyanobacterium RM2_1_1]|nr:hypothetical protein [Oscillatoriales cyanobacterium SM2_3_0]NJO44803.1 hypothetical protein [Oscillatoriales cyanobacterium RM2_1_1]
MDKQLKPQSDQNPQLSSQSENPLDQVAGARPNWDGRGRPKGRKQAGSQWADWLNIDPDSDKL